jgi:hypothetical protein
MDPVIIQMKLDLYEKFYMEMQQIDQEEIQLLHKSELEFQYRNSRIEDNFIYLDEPRDLKELNVKEQQIIDEQNNLHNYEELKVKVNKFKNIYNVAKYITSVSKWISFV